MREMTLSGMAIPVPTSPSMAARDKASDASEEKEVAASFEAMFVQQMLKGMRQSSMGGSKEFGRQTFEEMFDEQIAKAVASQGMGLSEALFAGKEGANPQEAAPAVDTGQ